ncbi:MAG: hypothetical protein E7375_04165 [Clostridiales bacterium]|nr:hypothetical protein [Clostridiales bacterium]
MIKFRTRKFLCGLLVFLGLFFSVLTLISIKPTEKVSDYDSFNTSLMSMLKEYDTLRKKETIKLSSDEYKIEGEGVYIKNDTLDKFGIKKLSDGDFSLASEFSELKVTSQNEEIVVEKEADVNRLIVCYDGNLDGFGAVAKAEYNDYHIFQYEDADKTKKAFEYYSTLKGVESVSYDCVVSAESIDVEATAKNYKSWGAEYLGYDEFKTTNLDVYGQNNLEDVVVVVLDSGINTSHELFQGRILHQYAKNYTLESSNTQYSYEDLNEHGSHVSGIIADATYSNVKILPLKVLDQKGDGWTSMIISAIEYVEKLPSSLNVRLMNMSLGVKPKDGETISNALTNAVVSAYNKGILSIVAAGNEQRDAIYSNPANVSCAVAVSGLYQTSNDKLLFDSSYSNYGSYIDFAAPGTAINSANKTGVSSYHSLTGTSMATPHVTACYALVYSSPTYAEYSIDQMTELMQQSAIDLGAVGKDNYYGYGCISLSNIGIMQSGEVLFSQTTQFPTSAFQLQLTIDTSLIPDGGKYEIYYTTDATVSTATNADSLYSTPIYIYRTTKVTAIAYIYDNTQKLVQKTFVTSKTYYFDNLDLLVNYEYYSLNGGIVISEYNGDLTTLQVPQTINYQNVISIDSKAFNSSNVQILYLPSTLKTISASAFYGNSKIKEIQCSSTAVEIEGYAFRYSAIEELDISMITDIGEYAFANTSKLEQLYLPIVTDIAQHAFSASKIKSLIIGQTIENIERQTTLSIDTVYGYADTVAKTFADNNEVEFYDLTLRMTEDYSDRKIVEEKSTFTISSKYIGLALKGTIKVVDLSTGRVIAQDYFIYEETKVGDFEYQLDLTFTNVPVGTYEVYVEFEDGYYNELTTNKCSLIVIDEATTKHEVSFSSGNYIVYIDGKQVTSGTELYAGFDYVLSVEASEGYSLEEIKIGGQPFVNGTTISGLNRDLQIEVKTLKNVNANVLFVLNSFEGSVFVNEQEVRELTFLSGKDLIFKVVAEKGYEVDYVTVNDENLVAQEDGSYKIENVLSDKTITVIFKDKYYALSILDGNGCSYSISSNVRENKVLEGDKVEIQIATSEGYVLTSVIVNGKEYNVVDNIVTIDEVTSDLEVVIQCAKEKSSLFDDSVVVKYLILFIVIFVVFILAKLILHFARKEKAKL